MLVLSDGMDLGNGIGGFGKFTGGAGMREGIVDEGGGGCICTSDC